MDSIEHIIWAEKYRPQTVDACILPESMKKIMKSYVAGGEITSHLLLAGASGAGKTTVAKAMLAEIGADYIMINASLDRNIDTLRNTIIEYASKVSMFGGKRKYIILDEADYLNSVSMQPALRGAMDELSVNCGFILTCNYKSKIIEPIQGRCSVIDFKIPIGDEKKELLKQATARFAKILDNEGVTYDTNALIRHINRLFPNFRKTLNDLQAYSQKSGNIDAGILTAFTSGVMESLISFLKEKRFTDMRKWVGENQDVSLEDISKYFYDHMEDIFVPSSRPDLVLIMSEYDYRSAFVINKEINTAAMLTKIMTDVDLIK